MTTVAEPQRGTREASPVLAFVDIQHPLIAEDSIKGPIHRAAREHQRQRIEEATGMSCQLIRWFDPPCGIPSAKSRISSENFFVRTFSASVSGFMHRDVCTGRTDQRAVLHTA
jgi:hypothetical protein